MKEAVIFPDPHSVTILANRDGEIVQIPGTEFRAPVEPLTTHLEYYANVKVEDGELIVSLGTTVECTVVPIGCYIPHDDSFDPDDLENYDPWDKPFEWVGHVEPYSVIASDYSPHEKTEDNWRQLTDWNFRISRSPHIDPNDINPDKDYFYVMYQILHSPGVHKCESEYNHTDVITALGACEAINLLVEYKATKNIWDTVPEWKPGGGGGGGDSTDVCAEEKAKRHIKCTYAGFLSDWAADADTIDTNGQMSNTTSGPCFVVDDPDDIALLRTLYGLPSFYWDKDSAAAIAPWMDLEDAVGYWRVQMVNGAEQWQMRPLQYDYHLGNDKIGNEFDTYWPDGLGLYCPEQAQPYPWENGRFQFWIHIYALEPTDGDTITNFHDAAWREADKQRLQERLAEAIAEFAESGLPLRGPNSTRENDLIRSLRSRLAALDDEPTDGTPPASRGKFGNTKYPVAVWEKVTDREWVRVSELNLKRGGEYVFADRGDWGARSFFLNFKADFCFGPLTNTTKCRDMSFFMAGCDFTGTLYYPELNSRDGAGWLNVQHDSAWDVTGYFEQSQITEIADEHTHYFPCVRYGGAFFKSCDNITDWYFKFSFPMVHDLRMFFRLMSNLEWISLENFNINSAAHGVDLTEMFWSCGKLREVEYVGKILFYANDVGGMFKGCSKLFSLDQWNTTPLDMMFIGSHACQSLKDSKFNGWYDFCSGTQIMDTSWIYAPYCSDVDASKISDKSGFYKPKLGQGMSIN